ncbi:MAG: hypothetical protein ACXW3L_03215 [Limisphaerales bacterium]
MRFDLDLPAFERHDRWNTAGDQSSTPALDVAVPDDLRACIPEEMLVRIIDDTVRKISRNLKLPHTSTWDLLLAVLVYAYATGSYESAELEEQLLLSPAFSRVHSDMFEHALPSVALKSFRRQNRNAIEECLAEVLHISSSHANGRCQIGVVSPPSEHSHLAFRKEASTRLWRAIQADCWAADV